ncbi:MAG TPA: alpha/beta hydrolase [Kofleriaceae bacterium]|nr:alpha/beta hydrolase [Kofleriaceae bacterium]
MDAASTPSSTSTAQHAPFRPTAFAVEVSGHGRPIIFIPGLGCPGALWRDTVAHLDGYESHVLTLAGFAGQPAIDGPLAATTREQLARYVRDRKLDHPIIVGHSMGGFIAYWLAAAEPDLVGPTIIVDSGASLGTGDHDSDASAAQQARALWRDASDEQFGQQVHDIFSSMTAKPDRLAPLLDQVARSDRRVIGDAIYEQFTTDLRPMLTAIRSPVLVVLADGSLQDGMRAHAAKVPDHTVVVVPGAKHFVMLDAPDRFFATLDTFLAAHPAPSAPIATL